MLHGDGLGRVLLLHEDSFEQRHWLVDRMVRRAGLAPEQFFHAALGPGVTPEAIERGVQVIVPCGEAALRALTGEHAIGRWRGRVLDRSEWPYLVVPTFKLSRLLPRKQAKGDETKDPDIMKDPARYQGRVMRDLHYAVELARAGAGAFTRAPVEYLLDPSPEVFHDWIERVLAGEWPYLSFDIETPYQAREVNEDEFEEDEATADLNREILRISFAVEPGKAVTVPWQFPYNEMSRRLLEHERLPKLVWNGLYFDGPVLELNGYPVKGRMVDGMDAWHFLYPKLDKGLEVVTADCTDMLPWKHLSDSNPEFYSATDSDAALRNMLVIEQRLRAQAGGLAWTTFLEQMQLMPRLFEAGRRGNLVDLEFQEHLKADLDAEALRLDTAIQAVVPEDRKPRKRYKRAPDLLIKAWGEDDEGEWYRTPEDRFFRPVLAKGEVTRCTACGEEGVKKAEHFKPSYRVEPVILKSGKPSMTKAGTPKTKRVKIQHPCKTAGGQVVKVEGYVTEWDEILPFNAGSTDQLKAYMRAYKHPLGKNKKDADKETADTQHLEMLDARYGAKHPLYGLAVQRKKVGKTRSTYCPTPDGLGLIHSTYTNSPWTWRLGSRALNMQNWGKRAGNPWAKKARMQIISRPGHRLVQADSTSIEAVQLGWLMGDLDYIKLANQSVHAWLACMELGWDFTPDNVERVKAEHGNLYDQMKVTNHMTNYGGTGYVLWKTFPKLFKSADEADTIQQRIFKLLPRLEAFHYSTRFRAAKQGWLETPWGLRVEFYDVFTYDRDRFTGQVRYTSTGRPKLKLGKDGKAVIAFIPQHSAGMFMRDNLNLLYETELGQYMPANVSVHDGYTLDVPDRLVDTAVETLGRILTRPIPQMGGLKVGCEIEVGGNWAGHHPEKNPQGMQRVQKIVIDTQDLRWLPQVAAFPNEMQQAA
jgi:hypothetical protein